MRTFGFPGIGDHRTLALATCHRWPQGEISHVVPVSTGYSLTRFLGNCQPSLINLNTCANSEKAISNVSFSPFSLFPLLKTYFFFAIKMLASMPLWMNSGAVRPAACIHSATSACV